MGMLVFESKEEDHPGWLSSARSSHSDVDFTSPQVRLGNTLWNLYGVRYQPKYLYSEKSHYMQEKCAVWEHFQTHESTFWFVIMLANSTLTSLISTNDA